MGGGEKQCCVCGIELLGCTAAGLPRATALTTNPRCYAPYTNAHTYNHHHDTPRRDATTAINCPRRVAPNNARPAVAHVRERAACPPPLPLSSRANCPKMRLSAALLLCIVTQPWTATANVEKTIFLGPAAAAAALSNARPDLAGLGLQVVSPATTLLPLQVPVAFPTESAPHGLESWYLLRGLDHGRRYEVRICWPATVSYFPFHLRPRPSPDQDPSNQQTSGSILTPSTASSIRPTWLRHSHATASTVKTPSCTPGKTPTKQTPMPKSLCCYFVSRLQRSTTRPIAH